MSERKHQSAADSAAKSGAETTTEDETATGTDAESRTAERAGNTGDRPGTREELLDIDHDEYDPIGTLSLIALYFVILVILWTYTYFVEFLGNDLTVVGSILPLAGVIG